MTDPIKTPWPLILLVWAAGLGAAAQYGKISVVFDRLPELYPSGGAALGATVSLVGLLGIVLGVVAGVFVAAIGVRRALLLALWAGAGLSLWQVFVPVLPVFLITRVLEGAAHLVIVVAAPTLVAHLSAPRDRPLALTLWGTFFGISFAVLAWAGIPLAQAFGIPALFAAHAVFMGACALALARALPPDDQARPQLPGIRALRDQHLAIYRSPWIGAAGVGWFFYTLCFLSLLTLLPPGIDPQWRALVTGAMPLASIAVAMTAGVALMRRLGAVRAAIFGFVVAGVTAGLLVLSPGNPWLCLALAVGFGLIQGPGFAVVAELNDTLADRALANGGMAQSGNLGNTLGTPILAVAAGLGGQGAMVATAALLLLAGAVAHLLLARMRRRI